MAIQEAKGEGMIVTNNGLVQEPDVFVKGDYRDVLIKTRDLVYEGYELLTHPLFASIRMIFSPVRTLVLSDSKKTITENGYSMTLIGEAIAKYDALMARRVADTKHHEDYAYVDLELFKQANIELKKSM